MLATACCTFMRCVWLLRPVPVCCSARRRLAASAFHSSQEGLLREAQKTAWPEVNLDGLQVNKVGRRVRQHVNPLKEQLQEPLAPVDWTKTFQHATLPLTVDIGCGPGRFLLASAKRWPESNYLGLEIRQPLIDRANDWARAMELTDQVHFIYANANVQLEQLLKSYRGPVNLITIQFPDPHFKAKRKKRRIVQPALVQTIREVLQPGGQLFMQSDVLEVAESMWSEVEGAAADAFELTDGNFRGSAGEARPRYTSGSSSRTAEAHAWLASNPIGIPTEREVVSKELGLPVYRVLFIKK